MTDKPLAWLRIEASDEARCDSKARLDAIGPDWKQAKKAMNDAEEDLLDAQSAARESFPDCAYDQATSRALNGRIEHFEHMKAKFARIDSRKRSLNDEYKKLTESTLKMLSESREPGIFDAGEELGPNGWKLVKLRDLTGGPDSDKPIDKQSWPSQELESAGYHTVGEFVKGRSRLIGALLDDGEIAGTTLEIVDVAVYRFLERRKLLDMWPKGMGAPTGEQMTLLQTQTLTEDPEIEANGGFDGPGSDENGSGDVIITDQGPVSGEAIGLKLAGGGGEIEPVKIPNATAMYPDSPRLRTQAADRYGTLIEPWGHIVDRAVKIDPNLNMKIIKSGSFLVFHEYIGGCPIVAMSNLLGHLESGCGIPEPEMDSDVFAKIVEAWMVVVGSMGKGNMPCDEFTGWFAAKVVSMGGGAVSELAKWNSSLGVLVASFQDGSNGSYYENDGEAKKKPSKKKPSKKKTAKKPPKKAVQA